MSTFNLPENQSVLLPEIDSQSPLSEIPKPEWWSSLYKDDGSFSDAYKQQLIAGNVSQERIDNLEIDNINRLREYQESQLLYYNTYKKWRSKSKPMLPDEDDYVGQSEWELDQMDHW